MTLIALKDVAVTLGTSLFSNLNLIINKNDRIGLVAANGTGKSTLLRCLAGKAEFTAGDWTQARGLRVGHVGQDVPSEFLNLTFREVVLQALTTEQVDNEGWRVDIVLDDLDVPANLREKRLRELSGGWLRIALLARAWVTEPDILLLDEPTNHLDLSRIGFLQRWLTTVARGVSFVVASHDRAFLDAVTNRSLFIREINSQFFALPYSRARDALASSDAAEERRFDKDMKQAQQLRRQAAKLKNIGINSGSDLLVLKTKQLKERAEKLEEAARPAYRSKSAGTIRLTNTGTHAKALVTLENASVAPPDGRLLYRTGKIWINRGDRIVLLGPNGSGKTLLISMMHRAITSGNEVAIKAVPTIVLGHADQSLSHLDNDLTPFAAITKRFDVGDQRARSLLAGAGIGIDLQSTRMQALSGGQRARLSMLILRLTGPNFYLLDEPTNHLDIQGQEALEAELIAHETTCFLVSHDRTFVRNVGNRFWLIEGRKLVEVESPDAFFKEMLDGNG